MNLITRQSAPGAWLLATATLSALVAAPASHAADVSDTKLTWGGYVKLDIMYSHFSDGPVPQGIGRDTYIPNQIPVSATGDEDAHTYLDFHAKETRLFLRGESIIEGHKVGGYVEMDFIVAQGVGTEAVTNAYNPGLRNAYITYDQFLLGQDWSTFQNMGAIPDVLDFVAFPTDGTVFMRAPMIRYTRGNWVVSLENPETTIATNGGGPNYANTDDNNLLPDLVARYNFKLGTSSLALAGVARQLVDKGQVGNVTDKAVGYGLSFSGKVPLGDSKDDLRFMLNGGDGIGRFLALNTVGDAVIDDDGRLKTLRVINGYLALRHPWTDHLRSSIGVSHLSSNADAAELGVNATQDVTSGFVNLLYSPFTKMTFGTELRYGERNTVADNKGELMRLQFSAKYVF